MSSTWSNPKQYYEQVLLREEIDPSDKQGIRRKDCIEHWKVLTGMVDTSLSEKNSVFVDNWEVNADLIYHRHLELGSYTTHNGHDVEGLHTELHKAFMPDTAWEAFIVVDTVNGRCDLCELKVPGVIQLAWKFFQ